MTPKRRTTTKAIVITVITVGIVLPGGYGFVSKFVQFLRTLTTDSGGGFTIVPIMNYLLVAAGFGCLLAWAVVHGMFRDIEKPKYTLLDQEKALDAREGRTWRDA